MMGAIGTVLLYRRGRRAEALTIGGICLCYLRLQLGLLPALRRAASWARASSTRCCRSWPSRSRSRSSASPGPTIALAAISITTTVIATITHPLVGYENETVVWMRATCPRASSSPRSPPPTGWGAAGAGSGRSSWPPAAAVLAGGVGDARACACPRAALRGGPAGAASAWALFAALAPTAARDRPRRAAEHLQRRRPHRLRTEAALGQQPTR